MFFIIFRSYFQTTTQVIPTLAELIPGLDLDFIRIAISSQFHGCTASDEEYLLKYSSLYILKYSSILAAYLRNRLDPNYVAITPTQHPHTDILKRKTKQINKQVRYAEDGMFILYRKSDFLVFTYSAPPPSPFPFPWHIQNIPNIYTQVVLFITYKHTHTHTHNHTHIPKY